MPGTTSTALPSFSHDQHHKTDASKWKGGAYEIKDKPIYYPHGLIKVVEAAFSMLKPNDYVQH